MKKILMTFIILGGIINVLCAQQIEMRQQITASGTGPGEGSIGLDMPNMLPPSPSVSEITKYALVGPSLSTGAANTHIDLYTYSTKKLHIPITLNYSSTGLKVDQIASRVGLGWMLNAGGVISRTVVGTPDESGSFAFPPADFPGTRGSALTDYVNSVVNNGYDTQPDIFNYSFPGYSGRFIFKGSTISKLEQNNLIIQGNAVQGFTIITPEGVKYEFHAVETSSSLDSANPKYRRDISNAWYLTQITHPEGDIIYLKYESCQFSYVPSISQSIAFLDSDEGDPNETTPCDNSQSLIQNFTTLTNKGLFISEISSNTRLGGVLQFSYIPRQDIPGDVALRLIKLYDGTGSKTGDATLISDVSKKTIEMDYNCVNCTGTNPSVTGRMFLTGVDIDDQTYLFNYKDLDHIPARLSGGQDDFGYYNGKSGTILIPNRVDRRYTSGGDRHPNWFYAQNGLLNKVTYPTGGYDSLEYEPNQIYSDTPPDCDNPDQVSHIMVTGTSTFKNYNIYYSERIHVTCGQQTTINVSCIPMHRSSEGLPTYPQGEYGVFAGLADLNHNPITALPVPAAVDHTTNADFDLPAGDYYVYLRVQGDSRGIVTMDYNNSNAVKGNKDVAGVRIKRVLSYDQVGDRLAIKRYVYDTVGTDGITRSSGTLLDPPPKYVHSYKSFKKLAYTDPSQSVYCNLKTCFYTQLSSANYYETNGTGNHISYSKVTESIGDNYEGGGTEHTFFAGYVETSGILTGNPIPTVPQSNLNRYMGLEREQKNFRMQGNHRIVLKDIITNYTDDSRLYESTIYYAIQADGGGSYSCDMINTIFDYKWLNVAYYSLYSGWLYPSSVKTITYDANGQNPVSTVENYVYNNPVNQLLSAVKTTNSKGETLLTENFYPQDNITGLSVEASAAKAELVNRNIISPMILQKVSKNSALLGVSKVNYRIWPNNLVLPATAEAQVGSNPSEMRLVYQQYDKNGNILQLQKTGAPLNSYLWDYTHSYVTAQVVNAAFNDIAYTSFEADSTGNWNIPSMTRTTQNAITGISSYNLSSGGISKGNLNANTIYKVSYWLKSPAPLTIPGTLAGYPQAGRNYNGWYYYEHLVTGKTTITINGTALIDELRLYPANGQMLSYTYSPLTGISAQDDAKNAISYYDYDNFNRLQSIKDLNGNIQKSYSYNYAGRNVNYGGHLVYYNTQQSGSFTRNDCGTNHGTTLSYTKAAGLYRSIISQEDADDQARAALNAEGQIYANQNGSCIVCTGDGNKFLNNVCESGLKIYTKSVRKGGNFECTYHYEWSDHSFSIDYIETSTIDCMLN